MAHNCLWWNFSTSSLFFSAIVVVVCHFRIPQFEKMHFRHCWGRGVTIQKVHTGRLHIRMNYYMVLMGVFNAADAHFLFVPSLLSEFISEQPAAKLETRPKNNVPSNFFLVFFSVFFCSFVAKQMVFFIIFGGREQQQQQKAKVYRHWIFIAFQFKNVVSSLVRANEFSNDLFY